MTTDYGSARENMVENQVRTNDVTDLDIQDAMRAVARERFCAPGKTYLAYAESVVEYAPGWFLMEPRDVSKLLQAVRPRAGETALAICAPYAAAVMAKMGLSVAARLPAGVDTGPVQSALAEMGVTASAGDPKAAGPGGPYDVVVCEGAVEVVPQAWIDALAVNGRLAVVERQGPVGKARLYTRGEDGQVARREVFDATAPIMQGFEAAPGFAF